MRYVWNKARAVEAQVVGETVERIAEQSGGVCSAQALVCEARDPSSPLHRLFEWDDKHAATLYRREQARHVVRELRIVTDDQPGEPIQAFVHVVRVDGDQVVEGYRLTRLMVKSDDEYARVLEEALTGLRAWRRRYGHLSELAHIWDTLDGLLLAGLGGAAYGSARQGKSLKETK